MDSKELKSKTIVSTIIKLLEKFTSMGIQLVISIILARILDPEDYGVIAIIDFFIVISNVFIDSGLGVGLVQKKQLNKKDEGTILVSSLALGLILYTITYFSAPYVASFYKMPIVENVLRVYALSIIIASFTSIQNAIMSRKLSYSSQFLSTLISTVVSGSLGIILAIRGFGVWALVFQQLSYRMVYAITMIVMTKYVPRLYFSYECFKTVVSFSWKVLLAKLITNFFNQVRSLIIGKQYSDEMLGFYNKGQQVPATLATATDYSIQSVMFSAYSKVQDDIVGLKSMVRRSMKLSAYILFPAMIGLAAVADILVEIVLTQKWIASVPFLRIACLMYMLQPVNSANIQAINALGKSDISLRLEIEKRSLAIVLIIVAVLLQNIYLLAISAVIVAIFGWGQYMLVNRSVLDYSATEQLKDIVPILGITLVMGGIVFAIGYLPISNYILLLLQICVGIVIYVLLSIVFKIDSFYYIIDLIKEYCGKKKESRKND